MIRKPYDIHYIQEDWEIFYITVIVQSNLDDAEAILTLQKLAYQSEAQLYDDYSIPPLIQTLDEIKEQYNTHIFLKAADNAEIIGSVRAYEKNGTCYIGRLIVHPNFENQGIGKQLMKKIENCFNTSERFELFTGTKSKKNILFYQKLGYHIQKYEKLNDVVEFVYMEKSRPAECSV